MTCNTTDGLPEKRRFPGAVPGITQTRRQGMDKKTEQTADKTESEARAEARAFILAAIDEGRSAEDILDELTTFYDGDPLELF